MKPCTNHAPSWFTGHWRDWHRGHGCDRDDRQPRSADAKAEIASHEDRSTGFFVSVEWRGREAALRIGCGLCGCSIAPSPSSLEKALIEHSAICSISRQEALSIEEELAQ